MKKVLSIVLTLAMLLGTFLMLVPTASAADEGIYYENDFENVTPDEAAGLLAALGWKSEVGLNKGTTLEIVDGRLVISAANQETFIVVENEEALLNGYTVEYDMEILNNVGGNDAAVSWHTSLGDYEVNGGVRKGRQGWISQIRAYAMALAGAEDGYGWKCHSNVAMAWTTPLIPEGTETKLKLKDIHMSVKAVFDATNKKVFTYSKAYAENVTWTEADISATSLAMVDTTATPPYDYSALLTDDCRLLIYAGLTVALDNIKITPAGATEPVYAEDFADVEPDTRYGTLAAIGWESELALKDDTTIEVKDGKLVIHADKNASQECFAVIKDEEALKEGYAVDLDLTLTALDAGKGVDSALSVHSSLGDYEVNGGARKGRQGWIGQVRWNTNILAGAEDGYGWKQHVCTIPELATTTYLKNGETVATNMAGIHLSVRVAFDVTENVVKTYVAGYNADGVTWTEADAQVSKVMVGTNDAGAPIDYSALVTDDCRFLVYGGLTVEIDNVRIGTVEALDAEPEPEPELPPVQPERPVINIPGVYYEEDFNDVTATDAAGILASIGWIPEKALDAGTTIAIEDGRLVINASAAVDGQEAFIVLSDLEALKEGYAVQFDMEYLDLASGKGSDSCLSIHSSLGDYEVNEGKRKGRQGLIGQVRWNKCTLAGAEDGTGWKSPMVTVAANSSEYLNNGETVAPNMKNIRVSVMIVYDKEEECIKTYTQKYAEGKTYWTEDDLSQIWEEAAGYDEQQFSTLYNSLLTDDCRFIVYAGLKVALDNVRIGTFDALTSTRTVFYQNDFNGITATDTAGILAALGWRTEQEWAADTLSSVSIVDGRLVVDARSGQEELIVLENCEGLLEGYAIECDIEVLGNGKEKDGQWDPTGGPEDNCVGWHTMLSPDFKARAGRHGWISQVRAYAGLLAGSEDGTGWKNVANNKLQEWFVALAPEGTPSHQLAINVRIHWRAEFDPATKTVKTYAKAYSADELVWTGDNLCAESDQTGYESLLTDDLRLVVYSGMKVAIDNLCVFKDSAVNATVNGEATTLMPGPINLEDFADGNFAFAVINGTEIVTDPAYNVTASLQSIDVYSLSVTAVKGAAIRTTADAALRFKTMVSKAEYDVLLTAKTAGIIKDVQIGTLSIEYETLGAMNLLKMDTEGAEKTFATEVIARGEENYTFEKVIEVAADKLNTKYAATGFVIITFNDDTTLEVVARYDRYTQARSVAEIAQTLTFDENHGLTAAQLQVVNTFAAAYVED